MSAVVEVEHPAQRSGLKRKYSDVEKAQALTSLDLNGGNLFKTAAELGIPRKTLESWATDRAGSNWSVAEMRHENKKGLADEFEQTARRYLQHAQDPYVIAASTGRDAVFSAAIATDKMQLLRGQPTSITETVERQELVLILESALGASESEAIEVQAKPLNDEPV